MPVFDAMAKLTQIDPPRSRSPFRAAHLRRAIGPRNRELASADPSP